MIYILIDNDFGEYNGHTLFVGPKMNKEKFKHLIDKYVKEFDFIFQTVYDHFVEKYKMEIYAESEKELKHYDCDSEYYIDCEVHSIMQQILNYNNEQHEFEGTYCKMYVMKMMNENHNFELNPKQITLFRDLYCFERY